VSLCETAIPQKTQRKPQKTQNVVLSVTETWYIELASSERSRNVVTKFQKSKNSTSYKELS